MKAFLFDLRRSCLNVVETICVVGGRSFNPTSAPAHKSASLSLNEAYNPVEDAWFESSEKSDGLYDHAVVTIGGASFYLVRSKITF